jgi:hypothetical protein
MKRTPLLMAIVIAALLLSACGSRATSGTGGASRRGLTITPGIKLALGTIKLEGTPEAVDPAMAAKLLPLWQLLLQLDTSTSAAPQEVTAVLDQIRATMTPAQVSAISGMQISQADFASLFQPQGGAGATGGASAAGAAGANRGGGGGFGGGGFGGGGFVGGGGAPGGGLGGGATRTAGGTGTGTTTGSTTARSQTSVAVPGFLVNQVISLLQSKITS